MVTINNNISDDNCGHPIRCIIQEIAKKYVRNNLTETAFLIPAKISSFRELILLEVTLNYLTKYLNSELYLVVEDSKDYISRLNLHSPHLVTVERVSTQKQNISRRLNELLETHTTKHIIIYRPTLIISIKTIVQSLSMLINKKDEVIVPFQNVIAVDPILYELFKSILDYDFLHLNKRKGEVISERVLGEIIFLPKNIVKTKDIFDDEIESLRYSMWNILKTLNNDGITINQLPTNAFLLDKNVYNEIIFREKNSQGKEDVLDLSCFLHAINHHSHA